MRNPNSKIVNGLGFYSRVLVRLRFYLFTASGIELGRVVSITVCAGGGVKQEQIPET